MDRIGGMRELGGASEAPGDPNANLRGHEAIDRSGERAGEVTGLLIEEESRRVRFLRIATDPLLAGAARPILVPVEAIDQVEGDRVYLDVLRERIDSAPTDDSGRIHPPEYYEGLLDYYGYGPSVVPGVTVPVEPSGS